MNRVVLGVSGASGAMLSLAAAHHLVKLGIVFDLVVSPAAKRTLVTECGDTALADLSDLAEQVHKHDNIGARIASGSAPVAGMIVAPVRCAASRRLPTDWTTTF